MLLIKISKYFKPEEHGWTPISAYRNDDRRREEMRDLALTGEIGQGWQRWRIPFKYPAGLAFIPGMRTEDGGKVAWYQEPHWQTSDDREGGIPVREVHEALEGNFE